MFGWEKETGTSKQRCRVARPGRRSPPALVFQTPLGACGERCRAGNSSGHRTHPTVRTSPLTEAEPTPPSAVPLPRLFSQFAPNLRWCRRSLSCSPAAAPHTTVTEASPAPAAFAFHRQRALAGVCAVILVTGFDMKRSCVSTRAAFLSHSLPAFLGTRGQTTMGAIFCCVSLRCFFQ